MGNVWRKQELERNPEYAERFRRQVKDANLRRNFGITLLQYEAMHEEQGGLCAICGRPERVAGRSLAVDHDHVTGAVRELLCNGCNTGLGRFDDDLALLLRAVEYLRAHASSQMPDRAIAEHA